MKILYGVQATGQGHISRARAMAKALGHHEVDVTWLFSGRSAERLFDMEPFGHFEHRRGLTFATRAGRIRYLETVTSNNVFEFWRDIRQLDLSPYDIIVTDYEPVTAWAARLADRQCIGIGHQYAFGSNTPVAGGDWLSRNIMRNFAPVSVPLGLHWHPYAANVLPPILDLPVLPGDQRAQHILVYLPFEDQDRVTDWLQQVPDCPFIQYANGLDHEVRGNVQRHPTSIASFKRHLAGSEGVICNSGFELISECIQWQKPVLTRPLAGQMEQLSNALALQQLGYAQVMETLCDRTLRQWLASPGRRQPVHFADVASKLAEWLATGCRTGVQQLSQDLWSNSLAAGQLHAYQPVSRSSIPNPGTEALSA
jgi:uncharacterized protein (TIGR00661 family)